MNGQLLFTVTRDEVVNHLDARIAYHEKRAAELVEQADAREKEAEQYLAAGETVTDRLRIKNSSQYSHPMGERDRLRDDAIKHGRKAVDYKFYRAHVPEDAAFHLTRMELATLEFVTSNGY